ncbi:ABC transporter substrate-binding protein [Pseudomonas shirazica]|uniref:ABC transporter n=1 Tax=Pseudomonas taiwanensis SJ9 TaxID=1388762 RepID=V7DIP6_9PSED|nr:MULTISPECIES: ABC transporter substrate-binding protein [Pseudomonas]MDY4310958.1 ABC transporter substrate-binding protein [Pseudomonas putida]AEJ11529.1 extracellular solute-binding protein [Pseudomonas putida S16]AJG15559.1 extracellular solute-binding protein [Pseudomonas plecoglossicida]ESW41261.1 ABC transporter [Pseudomonas taiwanensis SJ9]MBF8787496.1 ABC transporter substrate-binding protein [Pseudomonas asiatica]
MRNTTRVSALLALGLISQSPALLANNLVFCSEGSPAGFDTAQYTSATDNDAAEPIYNRLVEFERGGTAVHPALATRWEVSEDGLRYTFHLREGVKFHSNKAFAPSRDFNADDVLFTFNRMLDKNHPFRQAYPTEFPYFISMGLDKNIARVEKTGPLTVVFTLNKVDAAFIQNLAMSFASILSAEYAEQLITSGRPSDINQQPIGTGPFVFQRYQKDSQIRYKGNKAYWSPQDVKIDNLVFSINIDPSVRIQKLRRNECQVTLNPRPADLPALKADSKLQVLQQPGFNLGYIAYNTQHPPFDRLEVRQAMDMAVNKQAIIQAVYQDSGQLAVNAMPPTQWSYDDSIKDAPFDPEKAKQLLQQAGVKPGTEITLWAMPVQRPYNPNAKLMAEMLQADWSKLGFKVRIVSYEWGEYLKRMKSGEHDIALIGWTGDNGDPDNWLGTLYNCDAIGSNNYSLWCDPQYDSLVKQAKQVTDRAQRTALYQQAQQRLKQQVPITPVAHSMVNQPLSIKVSEFKVSPFGRNDFSGVSVD